MIKYKITYFFFLLLLYCNKKDVNNQNTENEVTDFQTSQKNINEDNKEEESEEEPIIPTVLANESIFYNGGGSGLLSFSKKQALEFMRLSEKNKILNPQDSVTKDSEKDANTIEDKDLESIPSKTQAQKPTRKSTSSSSDQEVNDTAIIIASIIGAAALGGLAYKYKGEIRQGYIMKMPDLMIPKSLKKSNYQYKQAKNIKKANNDANYGSTVMKKNLTIEAKEKIKIAGKEHIFKKEIKPVFKASEGNLVLGIMPTKKIISEAKGVSKSSGLSVLSVAEELEINTTVTYKNPQNKSEKLKYSLKNTLGKENPDEVLSSNSKSTLQKVEANQDLQWAVIHSPDYRPVKNDLINKGADWINKQMKEGKTVYIHCKSGKGRSATMMAAYLIKYKNLSAIQAIAWIKKQRPEVSIAKDRGHYNAIKKFEEEYLKMKSQLE